MTHPRTRTGRSLAGLILVLLGLSTYGCGDTGTSTQPAELAGLSVSGTTLQPPFSSATTKYRAQVSNSVTQVTVTASPRVAGDTVSIDNQQALSQPIDLLSPGTRSVVIVVTETGAGGGSKTYTIDVTRAALAGNNSLRDLVALPKPLEQQFKKDTLLYTVSVLNDTGSVSVTPTLDDPDARLTVNGTPASSAQSTSVPLNDPGKNPTTTITIVVTAQNGDEKSYVIIVSRGKSGNNDLSGLTIQPGSLAFQSDTRDYTVNVGSDVPSVTVSATKADPNATISGDLPSNGRATIQLPAPGTTPILIIVTAPNGTSKTYRINVVKAAPSGNNNLSGLTIQPGSLAFNANTLTYPVNVGSDVPSVTVSATKANPNATMSEDVTASPGTATGQATILLPGASAVSSTTPILITVTAPNGASQTYRINVVKAALGGNNNLSGLTIQPGSLAFNANTPNYTVDVGSDVLSVTVSATKADPSATMAIGSVTVPPGTASGQSTFTLNGAGGDPTTISVTVTAQNGVDVKTYTISVIRPAAPTPPAKPATAPDLITADDFCPLKPERVNNETRTEDDCALDVNDIPFGTRHDNFTNKPTPRFRIPQPATGETPNLYVDGTKVDSILEQAAISSSETVPTLKPTVALSASNNGVQHTIASTVTNKTTKLESDKSDELLITISTGQSGTGQ